MKAFLTSRLAAWSVPIILIGLALLLAWLAPAEQTLGQGVKIVYIHVALIQAGILGLYAAGLVGLAVLLTGREGWGRLGATIEWVALGVYAAGVAVSALAQRISWGGIAWQEPRVLTALKILAAGLIAAILSGWLPWPRIKGLLAAALAGFILWSGLTAQNILHPIDAIGTSPSRAIQLATPGMAVIFVLVEAWIVWRLHLSTSEK
jgi:hypothetical protein